MRPTAPPGPPGWMPPPQGYPAYPGQPPYPGQGYPPPPGWMPPPPGPYHSAQLYPGQPYPYQPGSAQPYPAMSPLSPNLSDFTQYHNADQTWDGTPSDVSKELGLIDKRGNDNYPQGRENCRQFLRECLAKGLSFKIKAKKTKPYWTWFYELNSSASPMSGGGYSTPTLYGGLSPNLSDFTQYHDSDQTWDGTPSDVSKELGLIDQRGNDNYPQGRDNCRQFLRECQAKGLSFKIKAKKTRPYWTWYFEVSTPGGGYSAPTLYGGLSSNLYDFTQYHDSDQTWDGTPSDVSKELGLMDDRRNDNYPQGRDNCRQFLRECQAKGLSFKIKAKKTRPYWTWYFEVNSSASPMSGGYSTPSLKNGLSSNLYDFTQYHNADQTWDCYPSDVSKEMGLIDKRSNDTYPQGRDNCRQFLRECQAKGLRFKVKARKTSPYWTWYFELY